MRESAFFASTSVANSVRRARNAALWPAATRCGADFGLRYSATALVKAQSLKSVARNNASKA